MLMSESLEIGEMLQAAMLDRYGEDELAAITSRRSTPSAARPRIGRTPSWRCCGSDPLDLMLVIGGYNSSNTCNLARICGASRPTFHIADPDCLVSADEIRHRPVKSTAEVVSEGWLPAAGPVTVGLTSGASTPDNLVGAAVARLTELTA